MNTLHEEFEAAARGGAREAAERLRSQEARQRLAGRVRRGRMVRDAGIGAGSVAAVALVATAAVAVPRIAGGLQPGSTAAPSLSAPAPTAGVSAPPSISAEPSEMPLPEVELGEAPATVGGLAAIGASWALGTADVSCEALRAQPTALSEPTLGGLMPLPWAVESGRLYGWGDDVLVGGYPHPVPAEIPDPAQAAQIVAHYQDGATLRLVAADGLEWFFSVEWAERGDYTDQAEGLFVSLNAMWDCSADGVIPAGTYEARLGYRTADGAYAVQLSDLTVVEGVPSLPHLHSQG